MMILRFLGIFFILFVTCMIAMFANVDIMHMITIVTFILTSDMIVCKFLVKQYMIAIANEQRKDKDGKDE